MSKGFIDTTILTDILLKPGPVGKPSRDALATFSINELPCYAIKEFKAGPFSVYVYFHNVLLETGSLATAYDRLHRVSRTPKRYFTSTAIEALRESAFTMQGSSLEDLVSQYGRLADPIVCMAAEYRLRLKRLILQAWRKRRSVTSNVVDEISCYPEVHPKVKDRGRIEVGNKGCKIKDDCVLAARMKKDPDALLKLIRAIEEAGATREEDKRRITILKSMVRHPKNPIDSDGCRKLGDAIFAFFCPDDAVILTTNIRDHRPLAQALGKDAVGPQDLLE